MAMSAFTDWLTKYNQRVDDRHLRRPRRVVRTLPDGWCEINGRRVRNLASNDYLNLAHDERLVHAAQDALIKSGVGSTSSALVAGRSEWQDCLEERLAAFEGREAALVFPTGYAANLGTLSALLTTDAVVFSDRLNHASLIDGCRLSKARREIYEHTQLDALRERLSHATPFEPRFLVTDGVFSMDGNLAPLPGLVTLADEFSAVLVVDEAHGTGVLGREGRGAAEHLGVHHRIDVGVGTLSKALGGMGGFVTGSRSLIDCLWHAARTQFFSTALPPAICAAACAALEIVQEEPQRRRQVTESAAALRNGLREQGLTVPDGHGPIVPVILREPELTTRVAMRLLEDGFFVGAIRPPTVPPNTSRLRISLSAAVDIAEVEQLIQRLVTAVETCSPSKSHPA